VVSAVATAFEAAVAKPDFRRALTEAWLNWQTGVGLQVHPELPPAPPLPDDETIRLVSPRALAWAETGSGELVCSANGHSVHAPFDPTLVQMLEALCSGQPCSVAALLAPFPGPAGTTAEHARAVLQTLERVGALVRAAREG
jgi:hypothetical protein